MNTIFKHKILTGAMLFGAMLFASSCDDSEGLKVTPEVPYADKTLFEVITSDPDLSDFVEVLNACGAHCADSLFNHSRVYTLWAPTDGTFNKDSLIAEVEDGNRELVFKYFIESHIANHLRAASGKLDESNKILLLNEKMATFKGDHVNGYTFSGQTISDANIRVWNGVLHKLSSPAKYKYNIWEYLKLDSRIDSVANFLYAYDVTEFSESQSVEGPIKDGQQTYLDSVFVTRNELLNSWNGVGMLNTEDSTYTVYVPTNELWTQMHEHAYGHFNYNQRRQPNSLSIEDRDSLRNLYSRINVLKYMTYSDNEQRYVESPDSVMPAWQGMHTFTSRPLFAKAQLEENVIHEEPLSNGTLKIVDKFPYTEFDLWHDTIKMEGEQESMRTLASTSGITTNDIYVSKDDIAKDTTWKDTKLSNGGYFQAKSDRNTVTLTYKLPDALSASYEVAVIIVPEGFPTVNDSTARPSEFTLTLSQFAGSGNKKEALYTTTAVRNNPTRVDTIYLTDKQGERAVVRVPYCEYYRTWNKDDYGLELELKTPNRNYRDLDKSIRLDAILLIPVKDAE